MDHNSNVDRDIEEEEPMELKTEEDATKVWDNLARAKRGVPAPAKKGQVKSAYKSSMDIEMKIKEYLRSKKKFRTSKVKL